MNNYEYLIDVGMKLDDAAAVRAIAHELAELACYALLPSDIGGADAEKASVIAQGFSRVAARAAHMEIP